MGTIKFCSYEEIVSTNIDRTYKKSCMSKKKSYEQKKFVPATKVVSTKKSSTYKKILYLQRNVVRAKNICLYDDIRAMM